MALQQTAHDACSRRVHCVSKGYLDDPFVKHFARDSTIVNSPLMNRGSWLRAQAFENMIYRFLGVSGSVPIQVVSLGAGVDTLYFRLQRRRDVPFAAYLEIDLPDLVEEKRRIILHDKELSELAGSSYHVVAGDLLDTDSIMNILQSTIRPDIPTIVIAECVFVYLDSRKVDNLLHTMMQNFFTSDVMLASYDIIEPRDRFGAMMAENLLQRGIVLHGVEGAPTLASHVDRYKRAGFNTCRAVTMRTLYLGVPKATQQRLNKLEMIDDWDEWNLVHDHYAFVIAWKGGDGTPNSIPPVFIEEPTPQ